MRVLVCVSTYVIHSQLNSPRAVTKEAGSRGCKHQQHGQMVHSADGKEEPTKGNGSVYTRHTLRFNVIRQLKDSERNDRWQFSQKNKKSSQVDDLFYTKVCHVRIVSLYGSRVTL